MKLIYVHLEIKLPYISYHVPEYDKKHCQCLKPKCKMILFTLYCVKFAASLHKEEIHSVHETFFFLCLHFTFRGVNIFLLCVHDVSACGIVLTKQFTILHAMYHLTIILCN